MLQYKQNTISIFIYAMDRAKWYIHFELRTLVLLGMCVFLSTGCASNYAPVEQRGKHSYTVKKKYSGKTPGYHLVKRGDTLYSIAWMYGQDYKSIAYKNRIKPPYRIYVGEKLSLIKSVPYGSRSDSKNTARVAAAGNRKTYKNKISAANKDSTQTKVRKSKASNKTQTQAKTKSTSNQKRAVNKKRTATFTGSKRLNWSWPVKGKIIQRYSPGSGKKGIDISASKGTLIRSAEAGKVVYSGQGLIGYGRLIIIKHDETYLSAYAHNQSLLVNEGQLVKKGQAIARLGRSGTDRYKLHFEIRKNGKPVNPVSYLP
jgi:lipoprotein NlpD